MNGKTVTKHSEKKIDPTLRRHQYFKRRKQHNLYEGNHFRRTKKFIPWTRKYIKLGISDRSGGISIELVKHGLTILLEKLVERYNKYLFKSDIPNDWESISLHTQCVVIMVCIRLKKLKSIGILCLLIWKRPTMTCKLMKC